MKKFFIFIKSIVVAFLFFSGLSPARALSLQTFSPLVENLCNEIQDVGVAKVSNLINIAPLKESCDKIKVYLCMYDFNTESFVLPCKKSMQKNHENHKRTLDERIKEIQPMFFKILDESIQKLSSEEFVKVRVCLIKINEEIHGY